MACISTDTRAVAVAAFEVVAVHAVLGLDVANNRLDRGPAHDGYALVRVLKKPPLNPA